MGSHRDQPIPSGLIEPFPAKTANSPHVGQRFSGSVLSKGTQMELRGELIDAVKRTDANDSDDSESPPREPFRRFTVLEHQWCGVHWDFLLQHDDGPLRTWAIRTPIVSDRDLKADRLPDHRAIYLDYEGPISGGRGIVSRWDSGTYRVERWTDDRILLDLFGERLDGIVVLRRAHSYFEPSSEFWRESALESWWFWWGKRSASP